MGEESLAITPYTEEQIADLRETWAWVYAHPDDYSPQAVAQARTCLHWLPVLDAAKDRSSRADELLRDAVLAYRVACSPRLENYLTDTEDIDGHPMDPRIIAAEKHLDAHRKGGS